MSSYWVGGGAARRCLRCSVPSPVRCGFSLLGRPQQRGRPEFPSPPWSAPPASLSSPALTAATGWRPSSPEAALGGFSLLVACRDHFPPVDGVGRDSGDHRRCLDRSACSLGAVATGAVGGVVAPIGTDGSLIRTRPRTGLGGGPLLASGGRSGGLYAGDGVVVGTAVGAEAHSTPLAEPAHWHTRRRRGGESRFGHNAGLGRCRWRRPQRQFTTQHNSRARNCADFSWRTRKCARRPRNTRRPRNYA